MHCNYLHWMDPGHQSQRVVIFLPDTRRTVIIFIRWISDTSLKKLLSFSLSPGALSLSPLDGSQTPVSKSCYHFPCHPLHCHYLHWMDPGHQSQRDAIFFPVTRCTVIIFIGWIPDTTLKELLPFSMSSVALSLSSLDGSRTPVSMSCCFFPCQPIHCHYLY